MAIPVALIAAGLQIGYGIFQAQKAKKEMEKLSRPQATVPEEIKNNLTLAQQRALEGLPEEQRKNYIQQVQRASSNAVNRLADRRSGLVGLAGIHQQEIDAYSGLLAQDVAARRANEAQLMSQRQNIGNIQMQQFDVNQLQPYRQEYNKYNALQGAGIQNVMGGVSAGLSGIYQAQYNKAVYDSLGLGAGSTAKTTIPQVNTQVNQMPMVAAPVNPNGVPLNQYTTLNQDPYAINMNQLNQGQIPFNPNNNIYPWQ